MRGRTPDSRSQALPGNALLARLRLAARPPLHPGRSPRTEEQAEPARQCVPRQSLGTGGAPGSPSAANQAARAPQSAPPAASSPPSRRRGAHLQRHDLLEVGDFASAAMPFASKKLWPRFRCVRSARCGELAIASAPAVLTPQQYRFSSAGASTPGIPPARSPPRRRRRCSPGPARSGRDPARRAPRQPGAEAKVRAEFQPAQPRQQRGAGQVLQPGGGDHRVAQIQLAEVAQVWRFRRGPRRPRRRPGCRGGSARRREAPGVSATILGSSPHIRVRRRLSRSSLARVFDCSSACTVAAVGVVLVEDQLGEVRALGLRQPDEVVVLQDVARQVELAQPGQVRRRRECLQVAGDPAQAHRPPAGSRRTARRPCPGRRFSVSDSSATKPRRKTTCRSFCAQRGNSVNQAAVFGEQLGLAALGVEAAGSVGGHLRQGNLKADELGAGLLAVLFQPVAEDEAVAVVLGVLADGGDEGLPGVHGGRSVGMSLRRNFHVAAKCDRGKGANR